MRKEKNGTRYFSFNEFGKELFNISNDSQINRDKNKFKEIKDSFETKHSCKACNTLMTYKGGNVMCCTNPLCTKQTYHLLSEKHKRTAISLYGEEGVTV